MKISIITVCYNSGETIKDTLESVLNQTYKNYEYIIVDGKSKDNTIDIIKSYEDKFEGRLKYISEKDHGLYDAMNKGIKMASGDIIGIINSDDMLASNNVFDDVVKTIERDNSDGVYGDLVYMNNNFTTPVRNFISGNKTKRSTWHPTHPTLYLRKSVYDKIGSYNTNYRIAADLDFMLRVVHSGTNLSYIRKYLVLMRAGGVSSNGLKGYYKNYRESNMVLKGNNISFPYLINILRIFKTINQGISAKIFKEKIMKKINNYKL
jgi:glycosyltransferase involved in cell wall biosynthesis